MEARKILIYLPEGFADWEGAFLMPELVEAKRPFTIVTETGAAVRSIGGLKVTPEAALKDFSSEQIELLVLLGSDGWQDPQQNQKVITLAAELLKRGTLVAAICGATTALARAGLLNDRPHTSNDLGMLKKLVPDYRGEIHYKKGLAVRDQNLITASGIGALEFTQEILTALQIYSPEKRAQWYAMFKNGVMPPLEYWS